VKLRYLRHGMQSSTPAAAAAAGCLMADDRRHRHCSISPQI